MSSSSKSCIYSAYLSLLEFDDLKHISVTNAPVSALRALRVEFNRLGRQEKRFPFIDRFH